MIKLPTDQNSYDHILECPRCGEGYLHHGDVTVYSRNEDDDTLMVATAEVGGDVIATQLKSKGSDNPSVRRHGLRIAFSCEHCGEIQDLCIAQHKGATFMHWDGE